MAVNKVVYGNSTLIDITDTSATSDGVVEGQVFYSANGARSTGTLGDATQQTHGLMSAADKIKLDNLGNSSSQIGALQIDAIIPTTAWEQDNNTYIATIVNTNITADMLVVEVWTDNDLAYEGILSGVTSSGSMTVTCNNLPTETINFHAALVVDSSVVLSNVTVMETKLANGLAIVADGDTHAAIAKDQFVFVRNHSTLDTGLYTANSAIGTNAALSTSNLTPDNQGGLNTVRDEITSLNDKLNSKANITNDVLADAVLTNGTKFFNGSGSSYTGEVPNVDYKYGIFTVMPRWSNKFVVAHSPDNEIAINYYNGSWSGWQQIVSSNNVFQEMQPMSSRCTVVSGGVTIVGKLAVINVKIHSAYSATNTPSMLSINVGTPKYVTALTCVKSSAGQGSMSGTIACHIGTNKQIYIQSVENDAYYDISGVVVLA